MHKEHVPQFLLNPKQIGNNPLNKVFWFHVNLERHLPELNILQLSESTKATTLFKYILAGTEKSGTSDQKKLTANNLIIKPKKIYDADKPH